MSTITMYKGIVKTEVVFNKEKSTGATYSGMNVLIMDGPAKGLVVLATRTTKTAQGVMKKLPELGQEVVLYHSILPSTKPGEKNQHFFEIGMGTLSATNADLDAIFVS